MKIYMRVNDIKEPTFDSLEILCNSFAVVGWEILTIDSGNQFRTATLVRDVIPPPTKGKTK